MYERVKHHKTLKIAKETYTIINESINVPGRSSTRHMLQEQGTVKRHSTMTSLR